MNPSASQASGTAESRGWSWKTEKNPPAQALLYTQVRAALEGSGALNRATARVEPKPTSTPDVWNGISVCNAFLADFNICYLFWSFKNLTLQSSLGICGEISFRNPSGCQHLQMLENLIANCVVDSAL